jgi:hypothetical protein
VVFIHNGILATKKNEILSFTGKWMELENIILSEVSQTQKAKSLHVLSHMWNIDLIQMQQYYEALVTQKGRSPTGGIG